MLINRFIIKNFLYSATISLLSCYLVFFIFSLIGNLNENYNFLKIILLSLINSLQIIFFIPSIIFLLIIFLFCHFLIAKNEIMIIRQYIPKFKILLILIVFIISFSIVEKNKSNFINILEEFKIELIKNKNDYDIKLIINKKNNDEEYIVLKEINLDKNDIKKINYFKTSNNQIIKSIYAENQTFDINSLKLDNFYEQAGNNIEYIINSKLILINDLFSFLNNNKFVNHNESQIDRINLDFYHEILHYTILYCLILLLLINNSSLQKNQKIIKYALWSTVLIVYSYFLFSINIINYNSLFTFLGTILIFGIFYKNFINE